MMNILQLAYATIKPGCHANLCCSLVTFPNCLCVFTELGTLIPAQTAKDLYDRKTTPDAFTQKRILFLYISSPGNCNIDVRAKRISHNSSSSALRLTSRRALRTLVASSRLSSNLSLRLALFLRPLVVCVKLLAAHLVPPLFVHCIISLSTCASRFEPRVLLLSTHCPLSLSTRTSRSTLRFDPHLNTSRVAFKRRLLSGVLGSMCFPTTEAFWAVEFDGASGLHGRAPWLVCLLP